MSRFKKQAANKTLKRKKSTSAFNVNKQNHQNTTDTNPSATVSATERQCDAYDENLLECARTQWQFGDWKSLAKLQYQTIETHPERAKLALLIATGHAQLGNNDAARHFTQLAKDWGCDKRLISKMLVAGVYNILGKMVALCGEGGKAIEMFEEAVVVGGIGVESRLFIPVRINSQISELNSQMSSNNLPALNPLEWQINQIKKTPLKEAFKIQDCKLICQPKLMDEISINNRLIQSQKIEYGNDSFDFFFRPESVGDVGVIKQIFQEKQYEFGWLPQGKLISQLYNQIKAEEKLPLIIDAGANIGASSVWLDIKFKKSIILAIEPDIDNCELIRINCANKNVLLFQGALADRKRTLYFQDPGQSDWGFRVGESGEREVNCISVPDILSLFDQRQYTPLILKIDIEGGESIVFQGNCNWIKSIPMIIIELHDWMLPGKHSSANFLKAVTAHDFEIVTRGENLICFNRNILNHTLVN